MISGRTIATAGIATALAVTFARSAGAQNAIQNGGFESGDLSGWTTTGLGAPPNTCPQANRDWNVSTLGSATGCTPVSNPIEGQFAAYNMFDGAGPLEYILSQSFLLPTEVLSAHLSFLYTFTNNSDANRVFGVRFRAGADNIFEQAIASLGMAPWTTANLDMTSVFQDYGGQELTLQFFATIPSTWTGPAGLGLDNVALNVMATPEPTTIILLASGLLGVGGVARRRNRRVSL